MMSKMFGCLCYGHFRPRVKDKFAPQSRKCFFVGYPHGTKGWKVCDLENNHIFIINDVIFHELILLFPHIKLGKWEVNRLFGGVNTIDEVCLCD